MRFFRRRTQNLTLLKSIFRISIFFCREGQI
nr:MAG TPA: hypothetical protein [Caudoviricetes sp.]